MRRTSFLLSLARSRKIITSGIGAVRTILNQISDTVLLVRLLLTDRNRLVFILVIGLFILQDWVGRLIGLRFPFSSFPKHLSSSLRRFLYRRLESTNRDSSVSLIVCFKNLEIFLEIHAEKTRISIQDDISESEVILLREHGRQ